MRDYPQVYIDGAWVDPQGGDAIEIVVSIWSFNFQMATGTLNRVFDAIDGDPDAPRLRY